MNSTRMEQFQKHSPTEFDSFRLPLEEAPEFPDAESEGGDEAASSPEQSAYTDDIVRVYLREMGLVSLLTRQGETNLARRMERGELRAKKVLSRSPLVQQMAIAIHEDVSQGRVKPADLIELSASGEQKHAEAMRRFAKMAKVNRDLRMVGKKLSATPSRWVHVRTQLQRKQIRLRIKLSQAIRDIRFRPAATTSFANAFKRAAEEMRPD